MRVAARPISQDGPYFLRGAHSYVYPVTSYYSADASGSIDSTTALQNMLNDAILVGAGDNRGGPADLGPGTFKISDTLTIPHNAYQYGSVGLVGHSPWATKLNYVGPNDRPAIFANKQGHFHLGDLTLFRSGARGTSTGVLMSSDTGTGTNVISGVIRPVSIEGFATGMQVGNLTADARTVACSEMVYQHLGFQNCDVGVDFYGFNSLNHVVQFLNAGSCGVGLQTTSGANRIKVVGGGGADNTTADFKIGSGSAVVAVEMWRSERVNRVALLASSAHLTLDHVDVADYRAGHDGVCIEAQGGMDLTMRHSYLRGGKISVASLANGRLHLVQCNVGGTQYLYPDLAHPTGNLTGSSVVAIQSYLDSGYTGRQAHYEGAASGAMVLQ